MGKNVFAKGPDGWATYDYHASIISQGGRLGGGEIHIMTSWRREGGPNNSPYIWTDHQRWSTDVPERPISILALIRYQNWMNEDPIDLRGAQVSAYLRGDNLDLDLLGGTCHFWAHIGRSRWHYSSQALHVSSGEWAAEPNRITLHNDEALWHRSWSGVPPRDRSLDDTLKAAESFGFSFIGFAREVSGRLSLADFELTLAGT